MGEHVLMYDVSLLFDILNWISNYDMICDMYEYMNKEVAERGEDNTHLMYLFCLMYFQTSMIMACSTNSLFFTPLLLNTTSWFNDYIYT